MEEDAEFIRRCIEDVLGSGRVVVLVMSSYGGFPGSEACRGLGVREREEG